MSAHPPLPEVSLDGPGTDTIAVGAHGDRVVLTFQNPVRWVALDSETAKRVGEAIARSGFACEAREDVYGNRAILVEKMRQRAVLAVKHLLTSEEYYNESKEMTAQRCVEICMQEFM